MFDVNRCMGNDSIYSEAMVKKGANEVNFNTSFMNCNMQNPVFEPMQERVCHKEFIHEVPHICPINTRVINHHIFRHTYTPHFTCCEENEVCNVYDNCCGNF